MITHIGYAAAMVFATVFVHAGCTVAVLGWLHAVAAHHWALASSTGRVAVLGALFVLMSLAAFLEAALWAVLYVAVDALPSFEQAVYFSLVTYTTLGYGDVTLDAEWRILGAFQAANGILMFGWTTALIVAVVQRMATIRRGGEGSPF